MPTASIKFTSDHLVAALQRYRQQHRGRHVGLVIKLFALVILAPIALWLLREGYIMTGVLFLALCPFVFVAHHLDYWLARRSFSKSPYRDQDVTIEFTDQSFHSRSPKEDCKLQWSVFTKVVHFRDGFLLFQGPRSCSWIPLASLGNPAQAVELDALLRAKITEHKVVERFMESNRPSR